MIPALRDMREIRVTRLSRSSYQVPLPGGGQRVVRSRAAVVHITNAEWPGSAIRFVDGKAPSSRAERPAHPSGVPARRRDRPSSPAPYQPPLRGGRWGAPNP